MDGSPPDAAAVDSIARRDGAYHRAEDIAEYRMVYAPGMLLGNTAQDGANRTVGNCRHSRQDIFRKAAEQGPCHVFVTTSQNTSLCGAFHKQIGNIECGESRHQRTQITSKRAGTKSRKLKLQEEPSRYSPHSGHQEDIRKKMETDSAHLRRTVILQPRGCTMDCCEGLGVFRKWQTPKNQRRDPNTKRTTALAHTVPWLDDEEL